MMEETNVTDESYDYDSFDEHSEERPAERWAPLGASASTPPVLPDSSMTVSEAERLKHLEDEQEQLNSSLLALTTHFAQVQFRLKQIVSAPAEEKEVCINKPHSSPGVVTLQVTQGSSQSAFACWCRHTLISCWHALNWSTRFSSLLTCLKNSPHLWLLTCILLLIFKVWVWFVSEVRHVVVTWVGLNSMQASVTGCLIGQELVCYAWIDWSLCLGLGNFVASASNMACGGQMNITFNQDMNIVQYCAFFLSLCCNDSILLISQVLVCSQQYFYLVIMTRLLY